MENAMSKVLERLTQQIYATKWLDLEELDKKYDAIESKHGYPPKRRYRLFMGGGSTNTLVVEREWESLADMEAAYEKAFIDPEWQAVNAEASIIIADNQLEILLPL
jgi:hypothetical protein